MSMRPLPPTLPMGPLPPTLLLTLIQMERRFRRILMRIYSLFNTMVQTLKSGRPDKYLAALVALREMNFYIKLVILTATSHLPQLHIPR